MMKLGGWGLASWSGITALRLPAFIDLNNRMNREARAVGPWLERTAGEADMLIERFDALLGVWERVGSAKPEQAESCGSQCVLSV